MVHLQDLKVNAQSCLVALEEPRAFFCGHVVQHSAAATVYPSTAIGPGQLFSELGDLSLLEHPVLYRGHGAVGGYAGWLQTPSSVFVLAPVGEKGVVGEALVLTSEAENIGMHLGGCIHHILTVLPQPTQQQEQQMEQQLGKDLEPQQQQQQLELPLQEQQMEQQQQQQPDQEHQQHTAGSPQHTAESSDQRGETDSQGGLHDAWSSANEEHEHAVERQQQLTAAVKTHLDSCFAAVQQRATKQKQPQSVLAVVEGIAQGTTMLGMAGGMLLYSCMRELQQQEAGGDAAELQYLLKGVQQLAHALVLHEQVQNLGGLHKKLLAVAALSILERSDLEERDRFRKGVLAELGAQQQRGPAGGGREVLVGLYQQKQQQQDELLSPTHKQQHQQQQQGAEGGGAGTYQQQRGLEDVVGKQQQQQQHGGVGDQELELQGTAPDGSSWRLPVLLEALDCCLNAALVCNSDSSTPSMYINYARRGGYGVQAQGGFGEGWPLWVQNAGAAEAHMWSALHVGKQQLEFRRACLVHLAVLLMNDLLPPGVFLPWQLVLSYRRVVPSSGLREEDGAVAAACAREEQLGEGLRDRDLESWAAYARKRLQTRDAVGEAASAPAASTAGDQARAAAVADGRGPGLYCGGHFWLAQPGVAGQLRQQLQPEAAAEAAGGATDLGREMEIDVEVGAGVGTEGEVDAMQFESRGAAAGLVDEMEVVEEGMVGGLRRISSKHHLSDEEKEEGEAPAKRSASSGLDSPREVGTSFMSGVTVGEVGVTEEQEEEQQGPQHPLQQQQEQQQHVIGVRVNPDFRRGLFSKGDDAERDAAEVRKRAKGLQGRKLGYVFQVEKNVKLAGDHVLALDLYGFHNLADAKGSVISTLKGIKEGRGHAGDVVYLLFNSYSTMVPLVSAGGGAGGRTLVVDLGPDMGRLTGEKVVPAVVVLLHSFYLEKGIFNALVQKLNFCLFVCAGYCLPTAVC